MKITKNQLKQIVQEELAAVIREGYAEDFGKGVGYVTDKVVNAPAKIGRAVKKVGSDILRGFDSQTDVRVPASDRKKPITPEEWAKTANPNDGSPRWADSDYTDAYDAKLASRTGELTPKFEKPRYGRSGGQPRVFPESGDESFRNEPTNTDDNTSMDYQFQEYVYGPFAGPPETVGDLTDRLTGIVREELAQVVSERERTESELFPGTFTYAAKKPSAAAAPDLRTSEPALPDEQYPTSPGEYGGNDRMMTSMPSTPEQDAYARKVFNLPEPATSLDVDPNTKGVQEPAALIAARARRMAAANAPTVFQGKKGDPYEYKEVDGQYQARKKGSDKWRKVPTNSPAHASIASVQKGGPSLYKRPKAPAAKPVDAAPAQKPAAPATPAVAAAPVSAKQQKRNQMADAFEKAQRKKGILTPKAQAKAAKIRKRGKKLNPFD